MNQTVQTDKTDQIVFETPPAIPTNSPPEASPRPWRTEWQWAKHFYQRLAAANGDVVARDVNPKDASHILRAVNDFDAATMRIANLCDDASAYAALADVQREQIEWLSDVLASTLDHLGHFFAAKPDAKLDVDPLERAYVGLIMAGVRGKLPLHVSLCGDSSPERLTPPSPAAGDSRDGESA